MTTLTCNIAMFTRDGAFMASGPVRFSSDVSRDWAFHGAVHTLGLPGGIAGVGIVTGDKFSASREEAA